MQAQPICVIIVLVEQLKTSLRRFFYNVKNRWLVFDNMALIICLVLCVWWTYGSIASMTRNWALSKTLDDEKTKLSLISLEVSTLELENAYYSSDEYAELSARKKFDKILPGESLVYLPDNTEYAKNKHNTPKTVTKKSPTNLEQWLSFLFDAR